jgi:hypothetical protein
VAPEDRSLLLISRLLGPIATAAPPLPVEEGWAVNPEPRLRLNEELVVPVKITKVALPVD